MVIVNSGQGNQQQYIATINIEGNLMMYGDLIITCCVTETNIKLYKVGWG